MSNIVGLSPKNPKDYIGPNVFITTVVTRKREPAGTDYNQPETARKYPSGSFWLIGPSPASGTLGDLWYLAKIVSNVATWVKLSTGTSGPVLGVNVDANTAPGTDPVVTDINGLITVTGAQVATGTIGANVIRTNSLSANTFTIQIQRSTAVASTDSTKNGVSHFDTLPFDVDSNGFVQLPGHGQAIESINVQANTGPGTDPVIPAPTTGQVTVNGTIVAAHSIPLRTNSLAANSFDVEAQYASAAATSVATNAGMASFDAADFAVDANGYVQIKSPSVPLATNIGFSISGSTFTVNGADGSALSSTNPAIIFLNSKVTPGRMIKYKVTANQSFTFGAASDISGWLGGLTSGDDWSATNFPLFVYAVCNSTEASIVFMVSRSHSNIVSPAAGGISKAGTILNVNQSDMFGMGSFTVADYATTPCLTVGSIQSRMSTANNMTVQTMTSTDGPGNMNYTTVFAVPSGTFGAVAGKYILANGGTAPRLTSQTMSYSPMPGGYIQFRFNGTAADIAGVGAVALILVTPYLCVDLATLSLSTVQGQGRFSSGATYGLITFFPGSASQNSQSSYVTPTASGPSLLNQDIGLNDNMAITAIYPI